MTTLSNCLRALHLANPDNHNGCSCLFLLAADEIERLDRQRENAVKSLSLALAEISGWHDVPGPHWLARDAVEGDI